MLLDSVNCNIDLYSISSFFIPSLEASVKFIATEFPLNMSLIFDLFLFVLSSCIFSLRYIFISVVSFAFIFLCSL